LFAVDYAIELRNIRPGRAVVEMILANAWQQGAGRSSLRVRSLAGDCLFSISRASAVRATERAGEHNRNDRWRDQEPDRRHLERFLVGGLSNPLGVMEQIFDLSVFKQLVAFRPSRSAKWRGKAAKAFCEREPKRVATYKRHRPGGEG